MQLFVEIIETQRCLVTKDNELHPGACDGNVHAAKVAQETDIALGIVSDQGNQYDVALLSLESVNGVDGNQTPVRFEERLLFHHLAVYKYFQEKVLDMLQGIPHPPPDSPAYSPWHTSFSSG